MYRGVLYNCNEVYGVDVSFITRCGPLMGKKLGCYRIVKQLSMPAFELAPEIDKSLVEFSYVQCVFYAIGSSISA